ncbi:MAG: hypothetical protein M3209_19295 [Acidobacteriota bacterium]|nr:hypothetical protein [Acidobacteriota bacterium]
MILHKLSAFSLVLWLLFQSATAPVNKPADNKPDELSPELKTKAVELLNAVARESQQFAFPENRVRAQTLAADLMWNEDEKAARAMFQNALVELQNLFAQLAEVGNVEDEMKSSEQAELYSKRYALSELRRDYVLTIAPHDPQMALSALQSLKSGGNQTTEGYDPLSEQGLELQLAAAIAKKDPEKAYSLAKNQLKDGISYQLVESLKDLFKKDSELAAKLSRDILAKTKSVKIRTPSANTTNTTVMTNANSVTMSVETTRQTVTEIDFWQVSSFLSAVSELNRQAARDKEKKLVPALTDSEMKELVELLGNAFLAEKTPAPYALTTAMRDIARYSPALAQRIRAKLGAEAVRQLENQAESSSYYTEKEGKNADELLAEAEKSSAEMRDSRLADAVWKAIEEQDPEKAQTIASKIKDRKSYSYIFEQVETALPLAKARKGDLQEVRKILATLSTNAERVSTITELATTLAAKNENETAKKVLEEALQLLPGRLKNQESLTSSLQVAYAYSLADPEQAFAMIENNIAQMNEIINAGVTLDEFYDYGSVENGELLFSAMNRQGLMHVQRATDLMKNLAKADFARAANLAEKFVRPEIRLFVRLKLAQSLLDPQAAEREKTEREQAQGEYEGH